MTPTGLFMSLEGERNVQLQQIPTRTINLEKVSMVNEFSRDFAEKRISLKELHTKLVNLDKDVRYFPIWLQIIAASLVSGSLMVIFGGVGLILFRLVSLALLVLLFLLHADFYEGEVSSRIFSFIKCRALSCFDDFDWLGY